MTPTHHTLLLLLCYATAASAQSVAIDPDAEWHEEHWLYEGLTAHHSVYTCLADGDTVIAGNLCTRIRQLGVDTMSTLGSSMPPVALPLDRYLGAIRVDEAARRWYVTLAGYPGELLLYDFNLELGSTTLGTFGDCGTGLTVTSVDQVMLDGEWRQRWHLNMPGRFIIEGIGTNAGLFGQLCQLFEEFSCLHVYREPDATLVVDGCGALSTSVAESNVEGSFVLAPNPTTGVVRVTGALPGTSVEIRDAAGRVVLRSMRLAENGQVDLAALAQGLYTIRIGNRTAKVVKE
ncbi:MAG TPA: T9SS type A sorting domain-containing protein [Flavobacteriales bacterium]|nr:T9SS type A sorting domain-containing protein [Flavobacteriales bacterium]HNU58157.1 T9SS type A sorting domain-containing protein [Flavobacteriales bacterium]